MDLFGVGRKEEVEEEGKEGKEGRRGGGRRGKKEKKGKKCKKFNRGDDNERRTVYDDKNKEKYPFAI